MQNRKLATCGLRSALVLSAFALSFAANDASADILKVLERNTLVLRTYETTWCTEGKPCDKPKADSSATDLRRVGELLYLVSRNTNIGMVYPIAGELDGLTHPAMKLRVDGDGRDQYNSLTISTEREGDALLLKYKSDYGRGSRAISFDEIRLSESASSCDFRRVFFTKSGDRPGVRMTFKTSCEILPIGAPETATGRDLVFRGLLGDYHKHLIFKAIGNSYANGFALCLNDSSWGGVAFKLEPGTEQGKFHCPPGDKYQGYDSGTYTSKVEKDGDRYTVRIIGNHFGGWSKRGKLERPTYNYPIEYELRFALRDGKCTLEHLSARQGKDAFRSNSQFNVIRSTPESTCGFE